MKVKQEHLYIIVVAFILTAATYYFIAPMMDGPDGSGNGDQIAGTVEELAKCLTEKGIVMYGSRNCGHCASQKEAFGDAFEHVTYVECTEDPISCSQSGVKYVPAWKIGGELHTGEKSFEQLSDLSGCPFG
jgi:hypothetical protein